MTGRSRLHAEREEVKIHGGKEQEERPVWQEYHGEGRGAGNEHGAARSPSTL